MTENILLLIGGIILIIALRWTYKNEKKQKHEIDYEQWRNGQ